jgi:hypothetical protein
MTNFNEQVYRIKDKIITAKKADKGFVVFGASSHHYCLGAPATEAEVTDFERKYSLELPKCYRAFITQIGNGGPLNTNSAAGPFYGIYPLGENVNELIFDHTEQYLKNACILYPKMLDEFWQAALKPMKYIDGISDEDYEEILGKLFAGILPLGSQGCAYIHGIVLNGPYQGRIVNLDLDNQKPKFAFENNFLDWYERWLDEIISGELLNNGPTWFGYTKGGSESELLAEYTNSEDTENKHDCLMGLLSKHHLSEITLISLEKLISSDLEPTKTLIQLICKSNYHKAKPYLIGLVENDLKAAFEYIYLYAKERSSEWLEIIKENIHRIEDARTFELCTYLLVETKQNYSELVIPFTRNNDARIRLQAFYALGQLKNKIEFIDIFIEGLQDNDSKVVHTTLQALSGIKNKELLPHYHSIAEKYQVEQDYVLSNLTQRLSEFGLTHEGILNYSVDNKSTKKWYEVWK